MISKDEVQKLAKLARIDMNDKERAGFSEEFSRILEYVSQLGEMKTEGKQAEEAAQNINEMRNDENPHESGVYAKTLLGEAPHTEGEWIKVNKVIKQDQ